MFECCHRLSGIVVGNDLGPGIAEKRISQDVIMARMCIDQIKQFFGIQDLIANIPISIRLTATINRNSMHC